MADALKSSARSNRRRPRPKRSAWTSENTLRRALPFSCPALHVPQVQREQTSSRSAVRGSDGVCSPPSAVSPPLSSEPTSLRQSQQSPSSAADAVATAISDLHLDQPVGDETDCSGLLWGLQVYPDGPHPITDQDNFDQHSSRLIQQATSQFGVRIRDKVKKEKAKAEEGGKAGLSDEKAEEEDERCRFLQEINSSEDFQLLLTPTLTIPLWRRGSRLSVGRLLYRHGETASYIIAFFLLFLTDMLEIKANTPLTKIKVLFRNFINPVRSRTLFCAAIAVTLVHRLSTGRTPRLTLPPDVPGHIPLRSRRLASFCTANVVTFGRDLRAGRSANDRCGANTHSCRCRAAFAVGRRGGRLVVRKHRERQLFARGPSPSGRRLRRARRVAESSQPPFRLAVQPASASATHDCSRRRGSHCTPYPRRDLHSPVVRRIDAGPADADRADGPAWHGRIGGCVWRADGKLAIKVVTPALSEGNESAEVEAAATRDDERRVRELKKEVEALGRLQKCRVVPRLYGHFERVDEDGRIWSVAGWRGLRVGASRLRTSSGSSSPASLTFSPFLDRYLLACRLRHLLMSYDLPTRRLKHNIRVSLCMVHEYGIVHNDVRLPNLLIRNDNDEVVIIDFGRALLHPTVWQIEQETSRLKYLADFVQTRRSFDVRAVC